MSLVNLGFFVGAISSMVGVVWLVAKMLKDDDKTISLPMALLCWGSIAFALFFSLGNKHAQLATERAMWSFAWPFFIGVMIFIASIPAFVWLDEHNWKDKTLSKLVYAVLCLAVAVPLGLYKLMN